MKPRAILYETQFIQAWIIIQKTHRNLEIYEPNQTNKWKIMLEKIYIFAGPFQGKVLLDLTRENELLFFNHRANKISNKLFLSNKVFFKYILRFTNQLWCYGSKKIEVFGMVTIT